MATAFFYLCGKVQFVGAALKEADEFHAKMFEYLIGAGGFAGLRGSLLAILLPLE